MPRLRDVGRNSVTLRAFLGKTRRMVGSWWGFCLHQNFALFISANDGRRFSSLVADLTFSTHNSLIEGDRVQVGENQYNRSSSQLYDNMIQHTLLIRTEGANLNECTQSEQVSTPQNTTP